MNRYTADNFKRITGAADSYKKSVANALNNYRQAMERAEHESKAYKEERAYLSSKKASAATTARNAIAVAEAAFTGTVKAEAGSLREEMGNHLLSAPTEKFIGVLRTFHDFGIVPTKAEINALLTLASGNTLSLKALDATLAKTGSPYRVKFDDTAALEKDLDALDRLAEGNFMYSPPKLHREACDLFDGTKRMIRNQAGELVDLGYKWSSASILTASAFFTSQVDALDGMAKRWTDSVLPTIFKPEAYPDRTDDATGEKISGAADYVADYEATAGAAEITDNPDAPTRAGEIGKTTAQEAARSREILKMYM